MRLPFGVLLGSRWEKGHRGFQHPVVSKVRSFILYWLPVLVWMVVIFSASSDTKSFQHSSRIIGPLISWLFPHLSAEAADTIIFIFRKCCHLTEFAILGLLLWRALRQPVRNDPRPWNWRDARNALLLVVLYASSDEFHQLFVPTRQASIVDVMIDTSGAVLGLGLLWVLGRWRRIW